MDHHSADARDRPTWCFQKSVRVQSRYHLFCAIVDANLNSRWKVQGSGTRVTIQAFHAGLKLAGQEMDADEAECVVANSIYKGFMKGYISHEAQTVVLAKNDPFPRLGDRVLPVGLPCGIQTVLRHLPFVAR